VTEDTSSSLVCAGVFTGFVAVISVDSVSYFMRENKYITIHAHNIIVYLYIPKFIVPADNKPLYHLCASKLQ